MSDKPFGNGYIEEITVEHGGRFALRAVVVVFIVLSLLAGALAWLLLLRPAVAVESGRPVRIEIASGSGTSVIGRTLAEKGVVRNPLMFRLQVRMAGADGTLRAGDYDLRTGMSYDEAIRSLRKGPVVRYVTVTVPEGFVIEQIAERFERQAGVSKTEFLELAKGGAARFAEQHTYLADVYKGSLEGYLFPKTYRVRTGAGASEVIEMMLDQFDKEIATVDVQTAEQNGQNIHQLVTLASMIERETKLPGERPLVSSVIHNRLSRGMRLEIDATIEYVLPGNRFRLRNSHLRIDSPYNTYKYAGLPPGPIASPGLASLQAAARPATTPYVYYVLTGKDGSHTFATNKRDFEAAKRKSKEVFGK